MKKYYIVFIVVILGCGFSVGSFMIFHQFENQQIERSVQLKGEELALVMKNKIMFNLETVEFLKAFYSASNHVDRDEFKTFTQPILERFQSIQALEWVPRVKQELRASYKESALKDGYPDFQIKEKRDGEMVLASEKEEYFPVFFVEPYKGNEKAFGFDLSSNATRLESLEKARDKGKMMATTRIKLVQETSDQYGFLLFDPFYSKNTNINSLEQRREHLQGFILGVFRIGDMMADFLKEFNFSEFYIGIFDDSADKSNQLLYFNEALSSSHFRRFLKEEDLLKIELQKGLHYMEAFDVGGRTWKAIFVPKEEYIVSLRALQPWLILVMGFLLTGVGASFFYSNVKKTSKIEHLVEERTQELSSMNENLQKQVKERKEMEEKLKKTAERTRLANDELKEANNVMINRELRMIDLKKEINDLLRQLGKDPIYND